MQEPIALVGLLAEVLTWVGFAVGALALFIRLIVKAVEGTWIRTQVVLTEESDGTRVRWVAHDGAIRERRLDASELHQVTADDEPEMYYRWRSPDRIRVDAVSHPSRILLFVGLIFIGVGVVAIILSIVLLIIEV